MSLFAAKRSVAIAEFQKYVRLGLNDGSLKKFHLAKDGRILRDG
jgi:hypothetical protein